MPDGGDVTVDLSATPGKVRTEWFDPSKGTPTVASAVKAGSTRKFTAPFRGDAVLWLRGV